MSDKDLIWRGDVRKLADWFETEDGEVLAVDMDDVDDIPAVPQEMTAREALLIGRLNEIIDKLQEQADKYNQRANELLREEDGQVSQYTWAVSLRETYRRIVETLDDLLREADHFADAGKMGENSATCKQSLQVPAVPQKMSAREYERTITRMFDEDADAYNGWIIAIFEGGRENAVDIIEKWAREHPERRSE